MFFIVFILILDYIAILLFHYGFILLSINLFNLV